MIKDSVSGVHRSKLIKPGTISLVSSITAGGSSIAAEAAADSDLRTYLQTEMFKAAGAAKVGSQINNHLGQLASATLEQFRTFSNSCNLLQTVSNNFLKSLANNFNLLQTVANWLQQIATISIICVCGVHRIRRTRRGKHRHRRRQLRVVHVQLYEVRTKFSKRHELFVYFSTCICVYTLVHTYTWSYFFLVHVQSLHAA